MPLRQLGRPRGTVSVGARGSSESHWPYCCCFGLQSALGAHSADWLAYRGSGRPFRASTMWRGPVLLPSPSRTRVRPSASNLGHAALNRKFPQSCPVSPTGHMAANDSCCVVLTCARCAIQACLQCVTQSCIADRTILRLQETRWGRGSSWPSCFRAALVLYGR